MRTAALWIFVIIWFFNLVVGAGAGYATLRFWYSRHQPLIREVGLFILSTVVDAAGTIVLLFLARGVRLTWKFSTVWFASALLSNVLRVPLILLAIRGREQKQEARAVLPEVFQERFNRLEILIQSINKEIAQMIENEHTPEGLPDTAPPAETPVGPPDHPQGPPIDTQDPLPPGGGDVPGPGK